MSARTGVLLFQQQGWCDRDLAGLLPTWRSLTAQHTWVWPLRTSCVSVLPGVAWILNICLHPDALPGISVLEEHFESYRGIDDGCDYQAKAELLVQCVSIMIMGNGKDILKAAH